MDKKTNVKVMNGMAEKIETLEDRIKTLEKINLLNAKRNTKYMEHFEKMADIMEMCEIADKRIDKVSEMADNINERCNVLTNFDEKIINCLEIIDERIHHLKSDIKELAKNDIDLESKIVENYDDLEAKNFIVKRDIDTINEEHEMFLEQLENKFITTVIERKYNNNEGSNNE